MSAPTKERSDARVGRTLAPDDPRHGTVNGYSNLGCRCDVCRTVWADHWYEFMKSRGEVLGHCGHGDCVFPQYAKGYCKPHYERDRTGRPMDTPIRTRNYSRGKKGAPTA